MHSAAAGAGGGVGADLDWVILIGLLAGIPAMAIGGVCFGKKNAGKIYLNVPAEMEEAAPLPQGTPLKELPSFAMVMTLVAIPPVLILLNTVLGMALPEGNPVRDWMAFIGHPFTALTLVTLLPFYFLGTLRGYTRSDIQGTPIHPMSPLVKLAWLRHERPDLFQAAARFISIKEYVFYRLLGRYVVDHSIATTMGLLNLETLDWDPGALAIAGVSPDSLSELMPTTAVLTGLKPAMAEAMGLRVETPIIAGASDGVLSNLGVGAISPGLVAVTVGTSGAVRAVVDRPITDPQERLFCYPLTEHHWVIGGAVNNGGIALRWVRDQLADAEVATAKRLGQDVYGLLTKMAAAVPPGSEGLLFNPYLMG